jgi:hypothetical protein
MAAMPELNRRRIVRATTATADWIVRKGRREDKCTHDQEETGAEAESCPFDLLADNTGRLPAEAKELCGDNPKKRADAYDPCRSSSMSGIEANTDSGIPRG